MFFDYFNPEQEELTLDNQMKLNYKQIENDAVMHLTFQNLRLYFLVPELRKLFRYYIDILLDLKNIPEDIKQSFK